MASKLYTWLDSRLRLKPIGKTLLDEPIPGGASWSYVFGSATLFIFVLQAITGMFLAVYYVPSPDHAYDTVQYIQQDVWFGWFVRGLHHWGASAVMSRILTTRQSRPLWSHVASGAGLALQSWAPGADPLLDWNSGGHRITGSGGDWLRRIGDVARCVSRCRAPR